jgi:ABC-type sugar transport system ATPase subunit
VLREGRTVAEFDHAEVSQDTVMHAMAHGDDETARRQDGKTASQELDATPASSVSSDFS